MVKLTNVMLELTNVVLELTTVAELTNVALTIVVVEPTNVRAACHFFT